MSKDKDIEDLLGGSPTPKAKAKPAAKTAAAKPAKEAAKPAAKAKAEKPAKEARVRKPVEFTDGEKEDLIKRAKKVIAKGEINSKELATKLGTETRKLRQALYTMSRAGDCVLEPGASRAAGMQVFPAA